MSVNNVQMNAHVQRWLNTPEGQAYKDLSPEDQMIMYKAKNPTVVDGSEALREQNKEKGTAVESNPQQGTPAKKVYHPEVIAPPLRAKIDAAVAKSSNSNRPFYKNTEAQDIYKAAIVKDFKKQIEEEYRPKWTAADEKRDKEESRRLKMEAQEIINVLSERIGKEALRQAKLGDRIEQTVMFKDKEQKRQLMEALGDDAKFARFKKHNAQFIKDNNKILHEIMAKEGCTEHEAVIRMVGGVSGDFIFEKNEVETVMSDANLGKRLNPAISELRKAGYKVDTNFWENLGKAGAVALAAGLGGTAVPVIVKASASALAAVADFSTGQLLDSASGSDSATKLHFPWKNGAAAGLLAGSIAAAFFGRDVKEDDVLKHNPSQINFETKNFEKMSFGGRKQTENVKAVLRAIDSLDLTAAEKQQLLIDAAGENGEQLLSSKELVLALINGIGKVETKEKPPVTGPKKSETIEAIEHKEIQVKVDVPTQDIVSKPVVGKEEESVKPRTILIGNNMNMERIAKRLGIPVEKLLEANKGRKIGSGHTDCADNAKKYLLLNKELILPDGVEIDEALLKKYNDEFGDADVNTQRYITSVTNESFYIRNRDCYKNIRAASPAAEKAAIGRLIEEAKGVGLKPEYTPEEFMKMEKDDRMDVYNKLLNAVNDALFAEQERQRKAAEAAKRAKAGQKEWVIQPEGNPDAKSFAPGPGPVRKPASMSPQEMEAYAKSPAGKAEINMCIATITNDKATQKQKSDAQLRYKELTGEYYKTPKA